MLAFPPFHTKREREKERERERDWGSEPQNPQYVDITSNHNTSALNRLQFSYIHVVQIAAFKFQLFFSYLIWPYFFFANKLTNIRIFKLFKIMIRR